MADFRRFLHLARPLQNSWYGRGMVPGPDFRRLKMTIAIDKLQQVAISVLGAVLASSLLISAAIGPVPVI
jgi:hypothetical protein